MTKWYVEKKTVEGKTFYYKDVGSEVYGKPSFRLWIHYSLVKKDSEGNPFIEIPFVNARIVRTEKKNLVLRPEQGWNTFVVGVPCGYKGGSWFKIIEPTIADADIFPYNVYASQLGRVGISSYALVNANTDKIKIKWDRSGRLYGKAAAGITIYYSNGNVENLEYIPDEEALNELTDMGGDA